MNLCNVSSEKITELVRSGALILSELTQEELEVIYNIEVKELYRNKNHSMELLKRCAEELCRYKEKDPDFAEFGKKKITLDDLRRWSEKTL